MTTYEDVLMEEAAERDAVLILREVLRLVRQVQDVVYFVQLEPSQAVAAQEVLARVEAALAGVKREIWAAACAAAHSPSRQAPFGSEFRQRLQDWRDEVAMREGGM